MCYPRIGTTVCDTTLAVRHETYEKRELNGAGAEAAGANLHCRLVAESHG
jgi:hypothetical protein